MAKIKKIYVCQECGRKESRWQGKCPGCEQWGTLVEEISVENKSNPRSKPSEVNNRPVKITEISQDKTLRLSTGSNEFDRVLGGGIVPGAAILIAGEPGIGKSTLLLQAAKELAKKNKNLNIMYVSAEESATQLRIRAERIDAVLDNLLVYSENDLASILAQIDNSEIEAVIIDSIQMIYWAQLGSAPGTVVQVRECAAALILQAKRKKIPLFLVGHVTKDGAIAGPKVLEHMVDVVLAFEGDRFHAARILRTVKNRFGRADEIGVFEMIDTGLKAVEDPSVLFLSNYRKNTPGSVITAPLSGSRPVLAEVQALVTNSIPGMALRRVSGAEQNRVVMLIAVLEKRCGLLLKDQDIFVNVVAGTEAKEPGTDLAIALAIASSFKEYHLLEETLVLGEVGLGGEVRTVTQTEARLEEASRLGFKYAVIPVSNKVKHNGVELIKVATVQEALECLEK